MAAYRDPYTVDDSADPNAPKKPGVGTNQQPGQPVNTTDPVPSTQPIPWQPAPYNPGATDGADTYGGPGPNVGATGPKAGASTSAMPQGIDPKLAAIYQQAGMNPGERGSGFADWQYWQDKPDQWARLTADLAGTGTDQPTGTPGQGAWSSSGAQDRGGSGSSSSGSMAGFTAPTAPTTGMPSIGAGVDSGKGGQLYDLLMQRAQQGLAIDPNDPIIKNQTDAFGAQEQRAAKDYESAAAEHLGSNANINPEMRSASEKVGQSTAGFQAQLMQQELNSRRQEIQSALTGAQGLLTEEQRMQLQEELAHLTLAQQQYQFGYGQQQQESQFARGLAQNQNQFKDTLGQNAYQFDSNDQFRNSPLGS